jgi:Tol biopolymer transport system component
MPKSDRKFLKHIVFYKYILLFVIALVSCASQALSSPPRLILAADSNSWNSSIYSPNSKKIAFTNAALDELWIIATAGGKPRKMAAGDLIGRRFIFEPGLERIVYRQKSLALPTQPVRLVSTSFYIYDPVLRTGNDGNILGPYQIGDKVYYRTSLAEPLLDYGATPQVAAPYLDLPRGRLWIKNSQGEEIFTSTPPSHFVGMEISPDGKMLAAVQDKPVLSVSLINMSDGKVTNIGHAEWPSWSGDSQNFIYLFPASKERKAAEIRLYRLSMGISETVLSSTDYEPETPSLNYDGTRALFVSKGAIYELILAR